MPQELGGLGLELAELCEMLRTLAHACPSTALAFAMHTHQVAINAWRWRHQKAPTAPLLEKVARERVVLISTGGDPIALALKSGNFGAPDFFLRAFRVLGA